jgi:hypothetical protein
MSEDKPKTRHQFKAGNHYSKGRPKGSPNKPTPPTKENLLIRIDKLYNDSIKNDERRLALNAIFLQAKLLGMLRTRKLPPITKLSEMTQEELREFIEIMEENEPGLKERYERENASIK